MKYPVVWDVDLVKTDVSDERLTAIFRVERINDLRTALAITSRRLPPALRRMKPFRENRLVVMVSFIGCLIQAMLVILTTRSVSLVFLTDSAGYISMYGLTPAPNHRLFRK
jgi:hypothetical protein